MSPIRRFIPMAAAVLAIPAALWALQPGGGEREPLDPAGVQRLVANTGGAARVAIHPATGAARFVRLAPGAEGNLAPKRAKAPASFEEDSEAFFFEYGSIFGIREPRAELVLEKTVTDRQGTTSLTYRQFYRGVPVFAGELKTHFNARKQLSAVNGTFVPQVAINTAPSRTWQEASRIALGRVEKEKAGSESLAVRGTTLQVFRSGLVRGVAGQNHLVWEVEVGNGEDVREFVYVDAHSGKVVDQITGIHDALNRRAYNTTANYPNNPFWVEGQAFPTADPEANNVIDFSGDSYNLYSQAFGRDSFDGAGATMHGVFRRTQTCPNASWNSVFTSYCAGVSSDDVVAHEWTHAYTEYTHGLIYQWQPGALNEAYSDMYGEVVDLINGDGTDSPGGNRTEGNCSAFTAFPVVVDVNSPASIAGTYPAGRAQFGPPLTSSGLTGDVVLADDGVGTGIPPALAATDGCCAGPSFVCAPNSWPNAAQINGKIALVDRGTCGFAIKVKNAQVNGAIGVIVANNVDERRHPGHHGGSRPDDHDFLRSDRLHQREPDQVRARYGRQHHASIDRTARHRQLLPLAGGRGLSGFRRRDPRHVDPHLLQPPRQGLGPAIHLLDGRQRRRAQQFGRPESRLCAARRRRDVQRRDGGGARPDQDRSHLLPRHDRLSTPQHRLRGPRRRDRAVLLGPDRRQPR